MIIFTSLPEPELSQYLSYPVQNEIRVAVTLTLSCPEKILIEGFMTRVWSNKHIQSGEKWENAEKLS